MLAENIKTLRKQKGFSQEEVAARLNVVRQTVSKWEKGLSIPDTETTMRLAELFGVSVSELIGEEIKEDHSADVAEQLSRLNALTAIEIQNKQKLRSLPQRILPRRCMLPGSLWPRSPWPRSPLRRNS